MENLEYYAYLQLFELDWCTRSKTNLSNIFMRSCTSTPGALPASAGDKAEAGILMKAQEDPSPRLEQLLHGYLRSQRILAKLVRDGSWFLARFHRLAIISGTGASPTRNRKFPHHTYLRFLHAWQLSCGLSRRLEDGGRDFSALSASVIGPTLGDCARCSGTVIVRAVLRPKTADYRCSMDNLANNFTC